MPWTKVKDGLPIESEDGTGVIAWFVDELFPDGDMSFMTFYDGKFLALNTENAIEDYTEYVTHWMYNPSKPVDD